MILREKEVKVGRRGLAQKRNMQNIEPQKKKPTKRERDGTLSELSDSSFP
jgi:hypothetical protein